MQTNTDQWLILINIDESANPCYMDTSGFILHVKTDNIYKNIAEDVEIWFDVSNFELGRPVPKEKNEKVIRLMKHQLCRQIIK